MAKLKLTEESEALIRWAATTDGQESHRVMQAKIQRLSILVHRLLDHIRQRGDLDES